MILTQKVNYLVTWRACVCEYVCVCVNLEIINIVFLFHQMPRPIKIMLKRMAKKNYFLDLT